MCLLLVRNNAVFMRAYSRAEQEHQQEDGPSTRNENVLKGFNGLRGPGPGQPGPRRLSLMLRAHIAENVHCLREVNLHGFFLLLGLGP